MLYGTKDCNLAPDGVKSYLERSGIPWPATGTMASEWSDSSRLKPLIADSIETTMKELYGEQVRLSGLSLNPVAQAHENSPPGTGRQICWQAFMLLLQPFEDSAESKWNQNQFVTFDPTFLPLHLKLLKLGQQIIHYKINNKIQYSE